MQTYQNGGVRPSAGLKDSVEGLEAALECRAPLLGRRLPRPEENLAPLRAPHVEGAGVAFEDAVASPAQALDDSHDADELLARRFEVLDGTSACRRKNALLRTDDDDGVRDAAARDGGRHRHAQRGREDSWLAA